MENKQADPNYFIWELLGSNLPIFCNGHRENSKSQNVNYDSWHQRPQSTAIDLQPMRSSSVKWFKRSNCCIEAEYHFFLELLLRQTEVFWFITLACHVFCPYFSASSAEEMFPSTLALPCCRCCGALFEAFSIMKKELIPFLVDSGVEPVLLFSLITACAEKIWQC